MANVLSGKEVAEALNQKMIADVEALKEKGITPCLAILRIGERDDDISYERGATKRCEKIGVAVKNVLLPADVDQTTLMAAIDDLNKDDSVHGVLMFRPMPEQIDQDAACEALDPAKDIDAVGRGSLATVFVGKGAGYAPCTAQACMEILKHYNIETRGKRAVVIGRSLVIGRPVAMLLMHANATPTICHTKTVDTAAIAKEADILVVAAGVMRSVGAEYVRPGQTVIDVGIHFNEETQKLAGDVKFEEVEPIVENITPVPGGVGSVTTSVLVSHVVDAAKKKAGL